MTVCGTSGSCAVFDTSFVLPHRWPAFPFFLAAQASRALAGELPSNAQSSFCTSHRLSCLHLVAAAEYALCVQELREQRHADAEAKKQSKGKKKGKDKAKQKEPKQLSTADAAKAWRHSQLTSDKGQKRYALASVTSAAKSCAMTTFQQMS